MVEVLGVVRAGNVSSFSTLKIRSGTLTVCGGNFSCYKSICSVISFHSDMSGAVNPQEFSKVDVSQGFPFPVHLL